jgi:dipeptide/tripeptide permease
MYMYRLSYYPSHLLSLSEVLMITVIVAVVSFSAGFGIARVKSAKTIAEIKAAALSAIDKVYAEAKQLVADAEAKAKKV